MNAFSTQDGVKLGSGETLSSLTAKFGTPFFFYNLDHVRLRARFLRDEFKKAGLPTSIHYAAKANSNAALLRALKAEGMMCDVVSDGEIETCIAAGFEFKDVLFSGVAKTRREVQFALDNQLKQVNVESLGELERIEEMSLASGKSISIGLRLNPNVSPETHPYITTGLQENKFGLEEDAIREAIARLKKSKASIQFRGLSLHIGSQLLELSAVDEALGIALDLQRSLASETGWTLDRFDAGGGIGINYATEDETAEFEVARGHVQLLKRHLAGDFANGSLQDLMIEPGRWLVARCGALVTEVQYLKSNRHKSFVIVDAGMNLLIRPALYEAKHRIVPLAKATARADATSENAKNGKHENNFVKATKHVVDVVGPICESADFLGRDVELGDVKQGDRIAIFDAGAYGRTMASNYNQRGWPLEVTFENGRVD